MKILYFIFYIIDLYYRSILSIYITDIISIVSVISYPDIWNKIRKNVTPQSIISYLIEDCSQNFSNFRESFPKVQRYATISFLIFNSGQLIRVLLLF